MKFSYKLSLVLLSTIIVASNLIGATQVSYVVSPFTGFENWYLNIKSSEHTKWRNNSEESSVSKEVICQAIICRKFFSDTYDVSPINVKHFGRLLSNFSGYVPSNITKSTKSYAMHEIVVNDIKNTLELVFPCFVWYHKQKVIKQVYISREYTATYSWSPDYRTNAARFRFVFMENERNQMVPIAIAEEPPELFNIHELTHNKETELLQNYTEWSRAICNLSAAEKVRLCAIVLGAEQLRETVTFPLSKDIKEPQCVKQEIAFASEVDESQHSFTAWAVKCEASKWTAKRLFFNLESIIYLISLSLEPHQLFISEARNHQNELLYECFI